MYRLRWIGVVLAVLLVAGCQALPPAPTPLPPVEPTAQVSPLTLPTAAPDVSPLATDVPPVAADGATPVPTVDAQGYRFALDRPVKAGDTTLKGTGLPGTLLEAHDITRMGVQLGGGAVGADGRFEIPVAALTPSIRVGITLVEPNDGIWANRALLGPESLVVPMVGAYLDTVRVEP